MTPLDEVTKTGEENGIKTDEALQLFHIELRYQCILNQIVNGKNNQLIRPKFRS